MPDRLIFGYSLIAFTVVAAMLWQHYWRRSMRREAARQRGYKRWREIR